MQRKPGFPAVNCNIKVPDSSITTESVADDEWEPQHRRQQLINFGHTQWGFNNWNWAVTKQDLELVNGKYTAGVAAFVSVSVKNLDIHRENVGYATSVGVTKGSAIHRARKCAVTNALRETLLSFGGNVATELLELVETKPEVPTPAPVEAQENNQNVANRQPEIKNSPRKDDVPSNVNVPHRVMPTAPLLKNATPNPPIATAHPMPANLPPAANRPPLAANVQRPPQQAIRPNSNVSFVVPVMGGMVPQLYAPPQRLAPPQVYPNYYEYSGPWHFTYETYDRHHGNVNLNFNIPPKNLVVNNRTGAMECKNACRQNPGPEEYQGQNQGCWIKPTIFYDGFWTEQKVKKWVAEQVEKQFPEDSTNKPVSPKAPDHPYNKP
ncbi:unnamed protein product [Leptidea sinapis]|uniref:Uncharacterized protein n=1 Tax=Leptidea sinapis TaxID=189913 RepID=A0A5E4QLB8_9NEOP|nr:unnamed protein product [Leptidea sinapis]